MKTLIDFVGWIVVHCSGDPADTDATTETIRRRHMQRGYRDIGYHFVIERDGTVVECRPLTQAGWHAAGYNRHSIGICLVGGRKGHTERAEDNFTRAQKDSLWTLLCQLHGEHPDAEIRGHRDMPGARALAGMCPSMDVGAWLQERIDAEDAVHSQDRHQGGT